MFRFFVILMSLFVFLSNSSYSFAEGNITDDAKNVKEVKNKSELKKVKIKKLQLAILDLKINTDKLNSVIGESISAVLAAELALKGQEKYNVMSRNEMKGLIQHQTQAQLLGCDDPKCASDLGKLAAADQIVTSSLGLLGDKWIFSVELVDVSKGLVLSRQNVAWSGSESGLVDLCRPYVTKLLRGSEAENYKGAAEVITNEKNAVIHVDNNEIGKSPLDIIPKLPIGKHSIKVSKSGFLPYQSEFVVNNNETTLLQVQLVDESTLKPWYYKWWVWTGAAVLIGGSITTAVMLREDPSTSLSIHSALP